MAASKTATRRLVALNWNPNAERMGIVYETTENDGADRVEHKLTSTDLPLPALTKALDALKADVAKVADVDEGWLDAVRGVRIHRDDEGAETVTFTATHVTPEANAPIVINTPAVEPPSTNRLAALIACALDYVDGKRAQGELIPS